MLPKNLLQLTGKGITVCSAEDFRNFFVPKIEFLNNELYDNLAPDFSGLDRMINEENSKGNSARSLIASRLSTKFGKSEQSIYRQIWSILTERKKLVTDYNFADELLLCTDGTFIEQHTDQIPCLAGSIHGAEEMITVYNDIHGISETKEEITRQAHTLQNFCAGYVWGVVNFDSQDNR